MHGSVWKRSTHHCHTAAHRRRPSTQGRAAVRLCPEPPKVVTAVLAHAVSHEKSVDASRWLSSPQEQGLATVTGHSLLADEHRGPGTHLMPPVLWPLPMHQW